MPAGYDQHQDIAYPGVIIDEESTSQSDGPDSCGCTATT